MDDAKKKYREIMMEGREDDGKFGRGAFDQWISHEPLNYVTRYLVHPEEAISLKPLQGEPKVFEQYGMLTASYGLNNALTISGGVATIPPEHKPMLFRRQNCEEALYIISGRGTVEVEDESHEFEQDNAVFLPVWARHRVTNTGSEPLVVFFERGITFRPYEGTGALYDENDRQIAPDDWGEKLSSPEQHPPVRYWRRIVVREEDRIPHFSASGEKAKSPGQQGYNYIDPANVGAITVRLVGGVGPAARLSHVKDPYKEFTMTWHNTEEIHYYIDGEGEFVVDDHWMTFKKGDTIFTPARSKHQGYPRDETYREMCATGVRFRPFEGLTESAIDQREYMED